MQDIRANAPFSTLHLFCYKDAGAMPLAKDYIYFILRISKTIPLVYKA